MSKICWVITDGSAGMENQAWGLAEALGYQVVVKHIKLRQPWLGFAPYFRLFKGYCLDPLSDALEAPYPELIIASGRRSILPALWIKEQNPHGTKLIYLQNPKISSRFFDAVICPHHDRYKGPNVIPMEGATHRITSLNLDKGRAEFSELLGKYKRPKVGVLIGGPNRVYRFDEEVALDLSTQLIQLLETQKVDLLITPSRRTPPAVLSVFKEKFQNYSDHIFFWDQVGTNPYFGILAMSDALLVTCESVSMISEVVSTDKPCYLIPLPGGSKKFEVFHERLNARQRTKWFEGRIDFTQATPWNETEDVVKKLKPFLL